MHDSGDLHTPLVSDSSPSDHSEAASPRYQTWSADDIRRDLSREDSRSSVSMAASAPTRVAEPGGHIHAMSVTHTPSEDTSERSSHSSGGVQALFEIWPAAHGFCCFGGLWWPPPRDYCPVSMGWTMLLFTAVAYAESAAEHVSHFSLVLPILTAVLYVSSAVFYIRCMLRDPGVIPRRYLLSAQTRVVQGYQARVDEVFNRIQGPAAYEGAAGRLPVYYPILEATGQDRYCRTCHFERPYLASHCRQCGHCVAEFDHHCNWVGNCIGRRNHGDFIWFLLLTCLLSYVVTAQSIYVILTAHSSFETGHLPMLVFNITVAGIMLCFLTPTTSIHVSAVVKGQTLKMQNQENRYPDMERRREASASFARLYQILFSYPAGPSLVEPHVDFNAADLLHDIEEDRQYAALRTREAEKRSAVPVQV